MDILSPIGFRNTLRQIMNIKPGGGFWTAPVWVFVRGP